MSGKEETIEILDGLETIVKAIQQVARSKRRPRWGGKIRLSVLVPIFILILGACGPKSTPAANYDATVPIEWFNLSLQLVQETPGFAPPVAARAFAYMGVALYETVRPGIPESVSLAGQLNGLKTLPQPDLALRYNWSLAANSTLASMTRKLFPTASPKNQAAMMALEERFDRRYIDRVDAGTYIRSVAWGQAIADAVFIWSTTDGGVLGYAENFAKDYAPPTGLEKWAPTPPKFSPALLPDWSRNRPFVLAGADACPAAAPPSYSEDPNSDFYAQALEVYQVGKNLTDERRQIALFWSDDPGKTSTPPGHWVSILDQVLGEKRASLDVAAEGYAKLGIAVADAFISCWQTKYAYNLVRPITYIQRVIDS